MTQLKSVFQLAIALLMVISLFIAFSSNAFAANGKIQHAYLVPAEAGEELYPEASAKLTRNCDTGEIILRGYGLQAGKEYEVRSGGSLTGQVETAVGNGVAGKGNNVLIKEIKDDESGSFWNLWEIGEESDTRILRGPKVACS